MQERPRRVYDILHLHAGGLYLNGVNGVGRFLLDLHLHVHLTEVLVCLERGAHSLRQGVVAVKVVLGLHPFASAVELHLLYQSVVLYLYLQQTVVILLSYHHRTVVFLFDECQEVFGNGHLTALSAGDVRILRTVDERSVSTDVHVGLVVPRAPYALKLKTVVVVCGRQELLGVVHAPLSGAVLAGESTEHHLRNESGVVSS